MNISVRCLVPIIVLLACCSTSYAEELSATGYLNYSTAEEFEDDEKIKETDVFNRNLYLTLNKPVTQFLSYDLLFRTFWVDTTIDEANDTEEDRYIRIIEPEIGINLANPMYRLSGGYRRSETWTSDKLSDDNRLTTNFYYSRFSVFPRELPSLSLDYQRDEFFDHLSVSRTDVTRTRYSGSSGYDVSYRDLGLSLNATSTREIQETPLGDVSETTTDRFSGQYKLEYSTAFRKRMNVFASYQGSYSSVDREQEIEQAGVIVLERNAIGGIHAQGTFLQPDVDFLSNLGALVDNDRTSGIASINIGTQQFHNTGIFVSSLQVIDRLFLYVDQDVTLDSSLTNASNWKVYKSNTNLPGTVWTEITGISVIVSQVDVVNNIYRYELLFSSPQSASYFKAVNMDVVVAPGITDVLVTEIEAWGEDNVSDVEDDLTENFTQKLDLRTVTRFDTWFVSLGYSIQRTENDPSLSDSVGGIFEDIVTKDTSGSDEEDSTRRQRDYRALVHWDAHRLLSTELSVQRSETFDDAGLDIASNTYRTLFRSVPLPTLDLGLTLTYIDRFDNDEKESTVRNALLTVGAELLRDVDFITDLGYQDVQYDDRDDDVSSFFINGTLNAVLSRKLSGNMTFNSSWSDRDGESFRSSFGRATVSYRPGRFINMSAIYDFQDSDGDVTTTENVVVDWRVIPTVRLDVSFRHRHSDPGDRERYNVLSNGTWAITRFLNFRMTYEFNQEEDEIKRELHTWRFSLNATI